MAPTPTPTVIPAQAGAYHACRPSQTHVTGTSLRWDDGVFRTAGWAIFCALRGWRLALRGWPLAVFDSCVNHIKNEGNRRNQPLIRAFALPRDQLAQ